MASGLFNLKQVNQAISQSAWSGYIAPRWVEYLVVAGGGGGSNGAGGAGGLLTGIVTVTSGTSYTVTVGAGGGTPAGNGNNSVFGSIATVAGGGGTNGDANGKSGGSGGGAGYGGTWSAGQGTAGQGNTSGVGAGTSGTDRHGGGGGGAGTIGGNATITLGGFGGAGIASAITGSVVTYAGGGGGGGGVNGGAGGVGGGGTGSAGSGAAGGGNTGGGGGGGYSTGGGNGGSGIVVVRYPGNVQFYTGGTVTYSNGYIVHNFTASGTLAPTTPTVVSEYQISRSLRFNSADSTYLSRTATANGSRTTATASLWVKRSVMGAEHRLIAFDSSGSGTIFWLFFNTSDQLQIYISGSATGLTTTQVFRDPSAWYHIVVGIDTNQNTSSDRIKLYVNGSQVTAFTGTQTYYSQGASIQFNNTAYTGYFGYSNSNTLSGYMTEVNWIDGQQLTATSFGYVNPTTGIWTPAKFVGGYGTNGAYLNFSDNSNTTAATLGKDYSGNGNNWTPNNFSVTAGAGNDSLVDSPTSYGTDTGVGGTVRGNYCTLNPLDYGTGTLSNGNLDWVTTSSTGIGCFSTFAFDIADSTNQYYWEFTLNSGDVVFGIVLTTTLPSNTSRPGSYSYYTNGNKYNATTASSYGASFTSGAIIGVAVGGGTITFYKNGVSQGAAFTGLTGIFKPAIFEVGCNVTANFGQRAFAYTAPSGFKALCTQNLPTPTIGATTATQASQYFTPVLYTGNNGTQSITVGFQPDFLWIKARSSALNHNIWDAVRTRSKFLYSNLTNAEATSTAGVDLISFDTNGFTLGQDSSANSNSSGGVTYVSWNWKANGSGSSNTSGSITSTVSANTTSGFSVVTYSGNGSNSTVGHGLGVAPKLIILKQRNQVDNWLVYSEAIGAANFLRLNTTDGIISGSPWQSITPTSSVVYLSSGSTSQSGTNYVMYCFAEVAGYSKFGSYTGNGSSDGPFVFTNMRPAYMMVKRTDSTGDWYVVDNTRSPSNVVNLYLAANTFGAEGTYTLCDFLSNGFKMRNTSTEMNASGGSYIYMCFAINPFKYSLAR